MMILEHKIYQALQFFGPLSFVEVKSKLAMINMQVESQDLSLAISGLLRNGMVRKSTISNGTIYAAARGIL